MFNNNMSHDNIQNKGKQKLTTQPQHEAWPEPVDGMALFNELSGTFKRYLALQQHQPEALALWTIFSHCHNASNIAPKLLIHSPEKRCGKTTLLDVLSELVWQPILASSITPAAIFRVIESIGGTLMIDEADTFISRNSELTGIINSGHRKKHAMVWRCDGDKNEPKAFSTWAPTIIAMIGKPQDTIVDRSIIITMRRKTDEEQVDRFIQHRAEADLKTLARKIAKWCADNFDDLQNADPEMPEGLNDRAEDNWRPLLAIADLISADCSISARNAAINLNRNEMGDENASASTMLLNDMRDVFDMERSDRIATDKLLNYLNEMEERPWADWNRGRPITPAQIANKLRPFGIAPQKMRFGQSSIRGYEREQFSDAFTRYLPETAERKGVCSVVPALAVQTTPPENVVFLDESFFD